jgi:hypothetical protein
MKYHDILKTSLLLLLLITAAGCWSLQKSKRTNNNQDQLDCNKMACFLPIKVHILPITKVQTNADSNNSTFIHVYLELLDVFNSQMKTPGNLRFELYEKTLRSAKSKGKRIKRWPDFDLRDPSVNNKYWQNFLHAYEFTLKIKPDTDKNYILQVTFLSPAGRRLVSEYITPVK